MAEKESDEGEDAGGRQRRPHDSAYKYLFSSPKVVHQFLTRFIDEEFTRGLTPDDVRRFESSFVFGCCITSAGSTISCFVAAARGCCLQSFRCCCIMEASDGRRRATFAS